MDERKNEPQDGALFVTEAPAKDAARRKKADDQRGAPGDGKAEESAELLDEILDLMDLDVDVDIRDDDEKVVLDVTGPDAGRVIGKKGQTLDALQFLLNKILNRFPEGRRHIIVDSGDYRERHDRGLVTMAKREAKKAVSEGRVKTLQPMSARDRRVIHLALAKFEGVETLSQGQGTQRRIQIIPQRAGGRRR
ncbi:MAG TPA: KH domain-containing protein [Polyangiaceae bacterium LLY-WYZ-15_(1-7)]|nr:KH domain-containing protein [Polyangiaceae bacterium LLY-WYZ-15_(1-7)]HJL02499.1 KH domain-containing protein [Polyangiaceae bacterium LLY-WYZ-15_(1-7)]HJL08407.1 KH domain-containing protein [Polyangiaceae bacterium LLY-WYZ-15_(1-7)]HJL23760.1 KH domain-containing protein [Polyangiaceae bacterium LLY-WYZ-15_(1-7)]HJL32643.1 KH domain-containing protein [Polyangiaceae bacterium LLY-WYZ-15_(1-7)]